MTAQAKATQSVSLTDFHNRPGEVIDRSQLGPVSLTKRNRTFAVLVSADYFERAEAALAALHGHRRALTIEELSDDDEAFISQYGPSDEEVRTGEWKQ